MDRQTVNDLVYCLGGYIITDEGGETSVLLPSTKAGEIFDLVVDDFDLVMLDDKINKAIADEKVSDDEVAALLETSDSWYKLGKSPTKESPTLNYLSAKVVFDHLCSHPGAAFLKNLKDSRWELWVKVGPR